MPIFHGGRIVAFASSMAHRIDIGGVLEGRTTDIYSEGLQIPFVKVIKDGSKTPRSLAFIGMNVRRPELALPHCSHVELAYVAAAVEPNTEFSEPDRVGAWLSSR